MLGIDAVILRVLLGGGRCSGPTGRELRGAAEGLPGMPQAGIKEPANEKVIPAEAPFNKSLRDRSGLHLGCDAVCHFVLRRRKSGSC